MEEDLPSMTDIQWKHYQAKVNRDLQMEAGAASSSGSVVGRSVVRPGMSGIEGDTLVESLDSLSIRGRTRDGCGDLTKLFNFTRREEEGWKLPIMEAKERILDTVTANPVTVLIGHTGCGKSTQVPQYILDKLAKERKMVNIIVTQPRKIAAKSLAERVCQERGWKLGGLVGYQVRQCKSGW